MLVPFAPLPIKGHSRMPVPESAGLQAAYLYLSAPGYTLGPRGSEVTQVKATLSSSERKAQNTPV